MWLVWVFAQCASEQEKLLARQGNILASDYQEVFVFRTMDCKNLLVSITGTYLFYQTIIFS